MSRALPSLACLFSVTLLPTIAFAQPSAATVPFEAADSGYVSLDQESFSGGVTLNGTYFDIRNQSGSGMGYTHGFTQLGAFTPYWLSEDSYIALNGRINIIGNGDVGFNTGLVGRRYVNDSNRIYGANLYYDRDRTYRDNRYSQIGFGIETLGQTWDFRANGYVPTGDKTTNTGPVGLDDTPFFFDNRIGFVGYERFEQALAGADFEFGIPLLPNTSWLRGFAGGYAYNQDLGDDPIGVRSRVEGWVSDDLSVGFQYTWDPQFESQFNAMIDWRFAGFKPTRYFPNFSVRERMLMPVQRSWRITVGEYVDTTAVLAVNPRDDVPYFVVWVDNSNPDAGDGTFENPFSTLPAGVDAETDMVLVRRGNTSQAAPLDGSIVLPDYARMLGEGKAHVFDAYANFGNFNVALDNAVLPDPAFTNSGAYPFLTSTAGDIIRINDHNEVSGFVLQNAAGRGIVGDNVNGFHLNNLEVVGNTGGGIVLGNATGSGAISADGQIINGGLITDINRNTVVGYTPPLTGAGNNLAGGILIETGATGLELGIARVSMNAGPGLQNVGVQLTANNGNLTTVIDDLEVNGNTVEGLRIEETGRAVLADISDLEANGNAGTGVVLYGDGGTMQVDLFDPVISGNGVHGLQITAINGAEFGDPGVAGVNGINVIDGDLSGNGFDAINVFADGASHVELFVDPTDASNSGRHGLRFETLGGSTFLGLIEETNFDDSGSQGIFGLVDGTNSLAALTMTDSSIENAGNDGLFLQATNAGTALVDVQDSSFDNAGQTTAGASSVDAIANTGGQIGLTFTNTTGNFSAANDNFGLSLAADGLGSLIEASITDGGFNNAGRNAVNASLANSSIIDLTLANTDGNNSGSAGLNATVSSGSLMNLLVEDSDFNNAGQSLVGSGLSAVTTGGSNFNAVLRNATFDGASLHGIQSVTSGAGSLARFQLDTVQANGNQGSGLSIASTTESLTNLRAIDSVFSGNGLGGAGDGVTVSADDSIVRVGFFDTTASNNADNGFNFNATNGAYLTARLDTITASNNGDYGVRMSGTGAGTTAALITEGVNTLDSNGLGAYSVTYTNVLNGIVNLGGSFNNSLGDGVRVDVTGAQNALVTVTGNGTSDTIDNNAGDGIDIRISDSQNAGVRISGYTSISNNDEDGVHVELTNITAGSSVEIVGPTDMTDNGDDGVDILLNNVALGAFDVSQLPVSLSVIDRTTSVPGVIDGTLPEPVLIDLADITTAPTIDGILVDGMNISTTAGAAADNSRNGIQIFGANVSGTGNIVVQNNVISGSPGNGIATLLTDSDLDIAFYDNNTITGNLFGDGVLFDMEGGSLTSVIVTNSIITDNTGSGVNIALGDPLDPTAAVGGVPNIIVDSNDVQNNTGFGAIGSGIMIDVGNTPTNLIRVSNNTNVSGNFGDGIRVFGTDSTINQVVITNNQNINSNSLNGINVGMDNTPINDLIIEDNIVNNTPPPAASQFNIDLDLTGLTPTQAAIFQQAAQRWQDIIIGDVPDAGSIDDVFITAEIVAIDGVGGILGAAGPTVLRGGSFLPSEGSMIFDSADVNQLIADGEFDEVILHEMAHVLGFGTIWNDLGYVLNGGTADPRYTGSLATAEYNARFGNADPNVPLENTGGPGTADSHWRETIFDNELMTGYLNSGEPNPISRITVAQFADLGYTVDISQADSYIMTGTSTMVDYEMLRPSVTVGPMSAALNGSIVTHNANLASNSINGININLSNGSDVNNISIARNQALGNGENGVLLTATDSTIGDLVVDTNEMSNNVLGDGFQLNLTNGGITGAATIVGNSVQSNGGNGLNILLDNAPINVLDIRDNGGGQAFAAGTVDFRYNNLIWTTTMQNTSASDFNVASVSVDISPTGQGWRPDLTPFVTEGFQPQNGSDVPVGLDSVNGILVTAGTDPLEDNGGVVIPNGGVPIDSQIITLDFNDFNPSESLEYNLSHALLGTDTQLGGNTLVGSIVTVTLEDGRTASGVYGATGAIVFQDFAALNPGISQNGLDGVHIEMNNGSDIATLNIEGNQIASNGQSGAGDGVDIVVNNSNLNPVTVTGNEITDHANGDGFRLVQPTDTDGVIDLNFTGNSIDGNTGGNGINLVFEGTSNPADALNITLVNNSVTNNGQAGLLVDTTNTVATTAQILSDTTANAITGLTHNNISGNGGIGVHFTSDSATTLDLTIGSTATPGTQNQFNGNGGAGVGIFLEDTATATANVSNAAFNNNLAGSTANFGGEGFRVVLLDTAEFTNSVFGDAALANTAFSGNASHGLSIEANTFSVVDNIDIVNSTMDGNIGDGINFDRSGDASITNILIDGNTITDNSDGIDLAARGADTTDTYTITGNTISDNNSRGISLFVEADADLSFLIDDNDILSNDGDGIQMTQNSAVTDSGSVSGTVSNNSINDNGGDGIQISAAHNVTIAANDILRNGGNGIIINGGGISLIDTNSLDGNGGNGIELNANNLGIISTIVDNDVLNSGNDGMNFNAQSDSGLLLVEADGNLIRGSGGDGVQIRTVNTGDTGPSNGIVLTNNSIQDSGRRGVNILNAGNTRTNITLGTAGNGNDVERSQLEGVYVVNTASSTQDVDALADTALDATGAYDVDPRLVFNMQDNFITANGAAADASQVFDTTGLVIRVGTSDGSDSFTDAGGFASNRGGVVATVTDNTFAGQFGADVTFQSFVSTVAPTTTTGAWTDQNTNPRDPANDVFDVDSFQSDPLARLDLIFTNNTGEGIIATRTGAEYTNAEAVFKSRTAAQDNATDSGPDDNGPFLSGSRGRNAQRQAGRFGLPPDLNIPGTGGTSGDSDDFLFSGVGLSTFRVDASGNFFPAGQGFIFDNAVYTNPATDADGLPTTAPNVGPFGIDNMPWGWGVLP